MSLIWLLVSIFTEICLTHCCVNDIAPPCEPSYIIGSPPNNLTGYIGQDYIAFTAQSYCHIMKVYDDRCEVNALKSPLLSLDTDSNGLTTVSYNITNLTAADNGKRIDVYIYCGNTKCFRPAYLTVKGRPDPPSNLLINRSCNGLSINGHIDGDTELLIKCIQDNTTIYEQIVNRLPHHIPVVTNYYKLVLTNLNLAGDSDPVEKNINFSDFLRYHVHINQTSYFNDILQVIVTVAVNHSCPVSVPRTVRIKSDCFLRGFQDIPNNNSHHTLNIYTNKRKCLLQFPPGGNERQINLSVSPVQEVFIPNNTSTGYFITECILLPGATGCALEVFSENRSVIFNESIARDHPRTDRVIANSSVPLMRGNYTINIYILKKDGTFNNSLPIMANISLECITTQDNGNHDNNSNHGDGHGDREKPSYLWTIGLVLAVMIIIIVLLVVVVAVIGYKKYRNKYVVNNRRRRRRNDNNQRQDIEGDIYNNRNNNEPAVCGEGGENEIEEREEGSDTAQAPVRPTGTGEIVATEESIVPQPQTVTGNDEIVVQIPLNRSAPSMPQPETQAPGTPNAPKVSYPGAVLPKDITPVPTTATNTDQDTSQTPLIKDVVVKSVNIQSGSSQVSYTTTTPSSAPSDTPLLPDHTGDTDTSYQVTPEEVATSHDQTHKFGRQASKPEDEASFNYVYIKPARHPTTDGPPNLASSNNDPT